MPGRDTVTMTLEPSWFEGGGTKLSLTVEFDDFVDAMEVVLCPRPRKAVGFTYNNQEAQRESELAARLADALVVMAPALFRAALNTYHATELAMAGGYLGSG